MKGRQSIVLAGALVAAAWFQVQAFAAEAEFKIQPRISSAFVWRGQVLSDEWCFQPALMFGGSNLSLTAWGNWDLTSVSNSERNTRMDITLDYSMAAERHLLSAGLVAYLYRESPSEGPGDTFEVYLRDTVHVLLLPSLTLYYDLRETKGFYGTFSLAHSFDLVKDALSLDLKAALGAGDRKYKAVFGYLEDPANPQPLDVDRASLIDLTVAASLPLCPRDGLLIIPTVKYMSLMDSGLRNTLDRANKDTDLVYCSLAVAYTF